MIIVGQDAIGIDKNTKIPQLSLRDFNIEPVLTFSFLLLNLFRLCTFYQYSCLVIQHFYKTTGDSITFGICFIL